MQAQQLAHEQQEELAFLRARYQEAAGQLDAAQRAQRSASAALPLPPHQQQQREQQREQPREQQQGVRPPVAPQPPAVRELARAGSQEGGSGTPPLERASPSCGSGNTTPTGGLHRSTSGGGRLSWLGFRR